MTSLTAVITEILEARDFAVSELDGYLIGKKGESEVAFCLISQEDDRSVKAFLQAFKDFKGRKVIATLKGLPDSFSQALDAGVFVWDREAIEREIGRTRIEKIVGEHDHGLVDELMADDYPKVVSPEELENVQTAEVGERIVKPTITMNDVREISRQTVGGFRYRLELVPFYVYAYSCDLYVENKKIGSESGQLSVNALTKKVEKWDDRVEIVFALDQSCRRLEPMLDAEEAKGLVRDEVVRVYSYEREIIRDNGQVTVVEKKKVSPRAEDVRLEGQGIFYSSIWCVEGIHGVMIVNAGTGKIISEDYYRL
ncbi:MAG: hypothetical protein LUQ27_04095 [Methanomassiliicoccales archaeon]|nr:hypothetical protein [Methanomassiliicoccales archaeon]